MDNISRLELKLLTAVQMHGRVVAAMVLRDIKTRMGGSYFGFILGLALPLGHLGIVLGLYVAMGRKAAIGTDTIIFLTSAILPFIIWSYTHQKFIQGFPLNIPLLDFPAVRFIDIVASRVIVEMLSSLLIVIVVGSFVIITAQDPFIAHPSSLLLALLISFFLGVSTGCVFGLLGVVNHAFALLGFLLIPLYWITSGVFFLPDSIPHEAQLYLWLFCMSHISDLTRIAIYPSYTSSFPSIGFVICVIALNLAISFTFIHFFRSTLRR